MATGYCRQTNYSMQHFKFYNKKDVLSLTKTRRFETKVGERIPCLPQGEWPGVLQQSAARFALFGIPEDVGVKANMGTGGADTCWTPFLQAFLNVQSNDFFSGDECLLLGHFDFGDLQFLIENNAGNAEEKVLAYRHAVERIDDEVETLVKEIVLAGKIPVAIGGGHNNAYPLIKGTAKALHRMGSTPLAQINCVNLDAHTDYRAMEGRHSGNAFRYAEADGFLGKYAVVGVHESYLPQSVLHEMEQNVFVQLHTYEDIFIRERKNFTQALSQSTAFTGDNFTGIELDLDVIENTLSSAATPCGISTLQARQYLHFMATDARVAYLHICEGAGRLAGGQKQESIGKLISFLVTDFVKQLAEG